MKHLDPATINPPSPRSRLPKRTLILAVVAFALVVRFIILRMERHEVKSEPPKGPTSPALPKRNP